MHLRLKLTASLIQVSTFRAVILRTTTINYQQVPDYSVDPLLVATGQYFACIVMMIWHEPQCDAVKEESAMIGKILLTLAVIVVAYLTVRRSIRIGNGSR